MSVNILTDSDLKEIAPSIFAQRPREDATQLYRFASTIEAIDTFRKYGFHVVSAQEQSARKLKNVGKQKHLVRLRHENEFDRDDDAIDILMFNSHNKTSSLRMQLGVFRFACSNGLVISKNTFQSMRLVHRGRNAFDVESLAENMALRYSELHTYIDQMKSIDLERKEQHRLAVRMLRTRLGEELAHNVGIYTLEDYAEPLIARDRDEDDFNDLYTVYNVVQEKLIKGSFHLKFYNNKTERNFSLKQVNGIDQNIRINSALWDIAADTMRLKQAA
jgi:hypothetical protein